MPVQWQRDNFWLYGAVEPATGEHFFYSFSHLDAACFGRFIKLFGEAFPGSLNLLHLDQASAHVGYNLRNAVARLRLGIRFRVGERLYLAGQRDSNLSTFP